MAGDVLAIVGSEEEDRQLVEAIAHLRPRRITLLVVDQPEAAASVAAGRIGGSASPAGQAGAVIAARRERAAKRISRLSRALERRTGAAIVGLAASREQLRGWRFDRVVDVRR